MFKTNVHKGLHNDYVVVFALPKEDSNMYAKRLIILPMSKS